MLLSAAVARRCCTVKNTQYTPGTRAGANAFCAATRQSAHIIHYARMQFTDRIRSCTLTRSNGAAHCVALFRSQINCYCRCHVAPVVAIPFRIYKHYTHRLHHKRHTYKASAKLLLLLHFLTIHVLQIHKHRLCFAMTTNVLRSLKHEQEPHPQSSSLLSIKWRSICTHREHTQTCTKVVHISRYNTNVKYMRTSSTLLLCCIITPRYVAQLCEGVIVWW